MSVTVGWQDLDTARPARDVVVRLTALTDRALEAGDITPYLMEPGPGRRWVWTADLPPDLRTSYQLCPAASADPVPPPGESVTAILAVVCTAGNTGARDRREGRDGGF